LDPKREWLTEGEIEAIAHRITNEGMERFAKVLENFGNILNKVAEGAQAQILSATLLHGDAALGLKGAIPDLQKSVDELKARMGVHEAAAHAEELATARNHAENSARLIRLEANQQRMKRWMGSMYRWILKSDDGTPNYKRAAAMGAAGAAGINYVVAHWMPGWASVKVFVAKLGALLGK
jgi:vacuolar-type H+-ATPase subunit E/Vma4